MKKTLLTVLTSLSILNGCATKPIKWTPVAPDPALQKILSSEHRDKANVVRDQYRHPMETLQFFGLKNDMKVLEMWPGGQGYYTEIIAPFLLTTGEYLAVLFGEYLGDAPEVQEKAEKFKNGNIDFVDRVQTKPTMYDPIRIFYMSVPFPANDDLYFGEDNMLDMVLTFRNFHNWYAASPTDTEKMLKVVYNILKPGGVFGVVDHREVPGKQFNPRSGYMPEQIVIDMATKAGFVLEATSDINNNPKDTKDYPNGVWTLPPTLNVGENATDAQKAPYIAIGESDRFTLKFVKKK